MKKINHWTKEMCQKESLKYNQKSHFKKNCSGAYQFAYEHGFLNEICNHMIKNKK